MSESQDVRLVIYTASRENRDALTEGLRDFSGFDVIFGSGGLRQAMRDREILQTVQILIVDTSEEADPLLAIGELIDICPPAVAVIALGTQNDIRIYRKMLEVGVNEYMFTPLVPHLVAKCMRQWVPHVQADERVRRGRSLLVCGVRGNCGASTVALRFARLLSLNLPRRVLVVDFNLQTGDLALQCDVPPNAGLNSIMSGGMEIDNSLMARSVHQVDENLDLLATLAPLDGKAALTKDILSDVLRHASLQYRYTIGEISHHQIIDALPSSAYCDTLILVSDARLTSAREVGRWRAWLSAQNNAPDVLHVLNQTGIQNSLTEAEFEKAAGVKPDIVIPSFPRVKAGSLLGFHNTAAYRDFDERLGQLTNRIALVPHGQRGLLSRISAILGNPGRRS